MKKLLVILASLFLIVSLAGCQSTSTTEAAGTYQPGTYTASATGRNGDVVVEVKVSESKIESVTVTENQETVGVADAALTDVPAAIVEKQSTEVDAVAGATITSDAIKQAVDKALAQAMGKEDGQESSEVKTEADVIVLGAGGAGLAAAATAAENGATVIILEANTYAGGATISSGAHMLYVNDEFNAKQERNDADLDKYAEYDPTMFTGKWADDYATLLTQIDEYKNNGEAMGRFDSIERVMVDHFVAGSGKDLDGNEVYLDYDIIHDAVVNNMEVYNWLVSGGMEIKDELYKDHANSPVDSGSGLINAELKLVDNENIDIQYETRATKLVVEDNKVVGVVATNNAGNEVTYKANNGVVIATGGFASNAEMVALNQKYGTGLGANNASTNPATNIGDGIVMAEEIGAQTKDMSFITTVMKGYHNTCSLGEMAKIAGTQQLVLNQEGIRFTDDSNASGIQKAMNNQTDGLGYFVGDKKMIDALNEVSEGFADELVSRGMAFKADTLEEVATAAGLDSAVVADSVEAFNALVDGGTDEFGRTEFNGKVEEGPYYIVKFEMHYHLTFGGLVVNEDTQVLDIDNNPISGLYAAGDVLSGFEGDVHQSGDCLSVVVTTGKTAGANAANNK